MTERRGELPVELLDEAVELLGRDGRRGTLPVAGLSMRPTLLEGQLLAVEFRPQRLQRGDILLLRQESGLVVHRLVGRARGADGHRGLRTRGDGTILLDPFMDLAQVKGRVIAVRDARGWRDLRATPARLYGTCVAWHDLFWAAMGAVAARIDPRIRGWMGRLDRALLSVAHRLLFRPLHRRTTLHGKLDGAGSAE